MENAAIAGAELPQNAAIEGCVLNSGILPLYRVEAVQSDFAATKPDVPLFRAPLYRATYCNGALRPRLQSPHTIVASAALSWDSTTVARNCNYTIVP